MIVVGEEAAVRRIQASGGSYFGKMKGEVS